MSRVPRFATTFCCLVFSLLTGCSRHIVVGRSQTGTLYKPGNVLIWEPASQSAPANVYVDEGICTENGTPVTQPSSTIRLKQGDDKKFRCTLKRPKALDKTTFVFYLGYKSTTLDDAESFSKTLNHVGGCKTPCPPTSAQSPTAVSPSPTKRIPGDGDDTPDKTLLFVCPTTGTAYLSPTPNVNATQTILWKLIDEKGKDIPGNFTIKFASNACTPDATRPQLCTVNANATGTPMYTATVDNGPKANCTAMGSIHIIQ